MSNLWKLLTLFLLTATLVPSPIQAYRKDPHQKSASVPPTHNNGTTLSPLSYPPSLSPSPSPSYDDDLSPEPQYPSNEEEDMAPEYQYPSPPAYAPAIEEDYPYAEVPSPDHAQDTDNGFYYSPYESPAPTPTESTYSDDNAPQVGATPPVLGFNYSAQEDTSDLGDDYEESYPASKKKNGAVIGIVMGAICLVGLGGLVYKKKQKNQKRDHPMYVQLSKKMNL